MSRSEPPNPLHLLDHGFTSDELQALGEVWQFAAAIARTGEVPDGGVHLDIPGVNWTPEKRHALSEYTQAFAEWTQRR